MDAYVFARHATPAAVETLINGVENGSGPARVVCPLTGDEALYVAVSAPSEEELTRRVQEVEGTAGLSGVRSFVALGSPDYKGAFPTYAAVKAAVGFAVVDGPGGPLLGELPFVVGAAAVGEGQVLIEVTGADLGAVRSALDRLPDGRTVLTAAGETAAGAGFRGE